MFSTPTKTVRPLPLTPAAQQLTSRLDTLARVSLYLLSQPSGAFASLVAPLLTPEAVPNTAVVILLDWHQPHLWLRQIWKWIQVIEEVIGQVGPDARQEMEDSMAAWKERGRGGGATNLDGTPSATGASGDGDGSLPLGQGEWTEPLGLPLCVVCQNVSAVMHVVTCLLTMRRPNRWNTSRSRTVGKSQTSTTSSNTSEPFFYGVSLHPAQPS